DLQGVRAHVGPGVNAGRPAREVVAFESRPQVCVAFRGRRDAFKRKASLHTKPPQIRTERLALTHGCASRSQERLHSRSWVHRPKTPENGESACVFLRSVCFSEQRITVSSDQGVGAKNRLNGEIHSRRLPGRLCTDRWISRTRDGGPIVRV